MRVRNFAFVVMLLGGLAAPPTLADLNEGLVAYYPFDASGYVFLFFAY